MARYTEAVCRRCRRAGVKLYLKHTGFGSDWTVSDTVVNLLIYNSQYASPTYDKITAILPPRIFRLGVGLSF